jgi:hypothetical protein
MRIDFAKFKWLPYGEQCRTVAAIRKAEGIPLKQAIDIVAALTGVRVETQDVRKVTGFIPTFTTTTREARPEVIPNAGLVQDLLAVYGKGAQ